MNDQMGSAESNQSKDIQKTYFDAISRTNTLIVSAGIIVVILMVVVGQELRDNQKRQKRLGGNIEAAKNVLDKTNEGLKNTYIAIDEKLNSHIREISQLDSRDIPKPTGRVNYDRDIETLVREEQEIKNIIAKLSTTLTQQKAEKAKLEPASNQKDPKNKQHSYVQISRAGNEPSSQVALSKLGEVTPRRPAKYAATEQRQGGENGNLLTPLAKATLTVKTLESILDLLNKYKDLYHSAVGPAQSLINNTIESDELLKQKVHSHSVR